jgi:hypothetical protein
LHKPRGVLLVEHSVRDVLIDASGYALRKPYACMELAARPGTIASGALWVHRDVAAPATEVRTILDSNDLKAIWDALNGWYVVVFALRQASHTSLLAERAP